MVRNSPYGLRRYKVFTLQAKEDTLDHLVTYTVLKFLMDNINIYIIV